MDIAKKMWFTMKAIVSLMWTLSVVYPQDCLAPAAYTRSVSPQVVFKAHMNFRGTMKKIQESLFSGLHHDNHVPQSFHEWLYRYQSLSHVAESWRKYPEMFSEGILSDTGYFEIFNADTFNIDRTDNLIDVAPLLAVVSRFTLSEYENIPFMEGVFRTCISVFDEMQDSSTLFLNDRLLGQTRVLLSLLESYSLMEGSMFLSKTIREGIFSRAINGLLQLKKIYEEDFGNENYRDYYFAVMIALSRISEYSLQVYEFWEEFELPERVNLYAPEAESFCEFYWKSMLLLGVIGSEISSSRDDSEDISGEIARLMIEWLKYGANFIDGNLYIKNKHHRFPREVSDIYLVEQFADMMELNGFDSFYTILSAARENLRLNFGNALNVKTVEQYEDMAKTARMLMIKKPEPNSILLLFKMGLIFSRTSESETQWYACSISKWLNDCGEMFLSTRLDTEIMLTSARNRVFLGIDIQYFSKRSENSANKINAKQSFISLDKIHQQTRPGSIERLKAYIDYIDFMGQPDVLLTRQIVSLIIMWVPMNASSLDQSQLFWSLEHRDLVIKILNKLKIRDNFWPNALKEPSRHIQKMRASSV